MGEDPRHHPEELAGARRRQAVCRHGERQVLHPEAHRERRRGARRGLAGQPADARAGRTAHRPSRADACSSPPPRPPTRLARTRPRSKPASLAKPAAVAPSTEAPAAGAGVTLRSDAEPRREGDASRRASSTPRATSSVKTRPPGRSTSWGAAVADGVYTASAESEGGYIKATVGGVTGQARVRVVPPLPWSFDFDTWTGETPPKHWTNTTGKVFVRDFDGSKGLTRVPDATPAAAHACVHGPVDLVQLHRRGRRARHREATDDERRRRHRAALRAGAVRQQPEDRAAALAGRAGPLGHACRLHGSPTPGTG